MATRSVRKCVAMIFDQNRHELHLESTAPRRLPCCPMLPLPLQFFIAMLAHAINERMARKMEYMHGEIRTLKEALRYDPIQTLRSERFDMGTSWARVKWSSPTEAQWRPGLGA